MQKVIFSLIFALYAVVVSAHDPKVPEGYDAVLKVISPFEKKPSDKYNLYVVQVVESEKSDDPFILIIESFTAKEGDYLAVRGLEKKRVVRKIKTHIIDGEIIRSRYLSIAPWESPADPPEHMRPRPDLDIIQLEAYMGDVIRVSDE